MSTVLLPARQAALQRSQGALDSSLCVLLCIYLGTFVLEGPLRYALALSGLSNALYLRDLIPLASVAYLFLRALLSQGWIDSRIGVPAALLTLHAVIGLMLGIAVFQVFFGLKVFLPVVYGIAMWPLLRPRLGKALSVACLMYLVTVSGVFLNYLAGTWPWEGFEYDSAFGAVPATRQWWLQPGLPRLPGFTRTSFNAASIIGITGMLAMIKLKGRMPRAAVALVTLAAILLTTSKGMVLAFALVAAWLLAEGSRGHARAGQMLTYALCILTLTMPVLVVYLDLNYSTGLGLPTLFFSAWERFTMMWPDAFRLLPDGAASVLGAGLGSIGTPQLFGGAPHRHNAGDNLAVFLIVNFGIAGVLYYLSPALAAARVTRHEGWETQRAYLGVLLIAYGYGMSINMIEESFFSTVLGLCCGAAAYAGLRERQT